MPAGHAAREYEGAAAPQEMVAISTSKYIAGIVGPTLIAVTVSETINLDIWKTNSPGLTYLNGMLLFVGGLLIVHAHNRWLRGWPVVLTLVGWLVMAVGLFRMFVPRAPQGGENAPTYAVIAAILAAGIFLTIKAYWPARQRTATTVNTKRDTVPGSAGGCTEAAGRTASHGS